MPIRSTLSDAVQSLAQTRVGEVSLDVLNAADNVSSRLRQRISGCREIFGKTVGSTKIGRAVGDLSIAAAYTLAGLDGNTSSTKE